MAHVSHYFFGMHAPLRPSGHAFLSLLSLALKLFIKCSYPWPCSFRRESFPHFLTRSGGWPTHKQTSPHVAAFFAIVAAFAWMCFEQPKNFVEDNLVFRRMTISKDQASNISVCGSWSSVKFIGSFRDEVGYWTERDSWEATWQLYKNWNILVWMPKSEIMARVWMEHNALAVLRKLRLEPWQIILNVPNSHTLWINE